MKDFLFRSGVLGMRKTWIPFSLLLLVLLICAWVHRASFGQPLQYRIAQKSHQYILEGTLRNPEEISSLKKIFAAQGTMLKAVEVQVNALLEPRGTLGFLEKIVPFFVSHYQQGRIIYQGGTLLLEGNVESEEVHRKMWQYLKKSPVPVDNQTQIVKPLPISFVIVQQKRHAYSLEGYFSTISQPGRIAGFFHTQKCKAKISSEMIDRRRSDKSDIIGKLEPFVPFFLSKVREGKIVFKDGKLTVSGKVMHQKEVSDVDTFLRGLGIEAENALLLNIKAIRGKKARKKAKKLLKILQKQRSKQAEVKKAEQEVSKDIVAMMDAADGDAAQLRRANKNVRKNLRTLFETEIIEFNAAQTTLTPLGLGTVSKIAVILKAYPEVKVEIAGHTDSDGDEQFNLLLSQGRVNSVKRALMKAGIAKERIRAVGYGESKPLLPNTTETNKQKNRRVEIIVIGA